MPEGLDRYDVNMLGERHHVERECFEVPASSMHQQKRLRVAEAGFCDAAAELRALNKAHLRQR